MQMQREFDSSAWTGRRSPTWWQYGFRTRHFAVYFGWSAMRHQLGLWAAFGSRRNPAEFETRYRWSRFWPLQDEIDVIRP
jgi:hypothetical protein